MSAEGQPRCSLTFGEKTKKDWEQALGCNTRTNSSTTEDENENFFSQKDTSKADASDSAYAAIQFGIRSIAAASEITVSILCVLGFRL